MIVLAIIFLVLIICIPIAIILSIIQTIVLHVKLSKANKEFEVECEKNKALRELVFKEREKIRKKYEAERQKKIAHMKSLKLEEVTGTRQKLWIKRKNGKIKELYNLESKRVPLAELAMSPGTKTIGIEPVLYYYSDKISKQQMLEDETEIRKLNNEQEG